MGVALGRTRTTDGLRVVNYNPTAARLKHPQEVYDFYGQSLQGPGPGNPSLSHHYHTSHHHQYCHCSSHISHFELRHKCFCNISSHRSLKSQVILILYKQVGIYLEKFAKSDNNFMNKTCAKLSSVRNKMA
jgi:hypothetical protein